MKFGIAVVGSLNLDMVAHVDRRPEAGETVLARSFETFLGGKGANQAAACGRLGAEVWMLGRVGEDTYADMLLAGLTEAGVDTSFVMRTPGSSGLAFIATDDHAQNSIVVVGGANEKLTLDDLTSQVQRIRQSAVILAQLETPLDTILHAAQIAEAAAVPFILDPAPARVLPFELLSCVTWLTPNEAESKVLAGVDHPKDVSRIAVRLLELGCRNVALKLGAAGVYLAGADIASVHVEGFTVDAVDSTAAGDAFNGAFGAALARGIEPISAARIGCAVAAISVTRWGAQSSLPTREDVCSFLEDRDNSLLLLFKEHFPQLQVLNSSES